MNAVHHKSLHSRLWGIANDLRNTMDPDQFRNYILGFIFYKYLSESMIAHADRVLCGKDDPSFSEIESHPKCKEFTEALKDSSTEELGYFLPYSDLFGEMAYRGRNGKNSDERHIIDDIRRIFRDIETSFTSSDENNDFADLFADVDLSATKLGRTPDARNERIVEVFTQLDQIDFSLREADADILGNAYEYLIGKFAAGAGKKAGEFYTPREVSTVLAKIVTSEKKRIRNVYDPTCGSGSLLIRVPREVTNTDRVRLFGQEMNHTTFNLARMNMIMHGINRQRFDIQNGDVL